MLPNYLIAELLATYKKALYAAFPLQSYRNFHDDAEMKKVFQLERSTLLAGLMQNISGLTGESIGEMVKELDSEILEFTNEFLAKHHEQKREAELLMENAVSFLTKEFESCSQVHLELEPYLETTKLHEKLEADQRTIRTIFRHFWKPGSTEFQENFQLKLESAIKRIQREIEDRQRNYLEGAAKDEEKLFEEFKQTIFQKLEGLKTLVPNPAIFAEKLDRMRSLIDGHKKFLRVMYAKIHYKILSDVMEAIRILDKHEGDGTIALVEQLTSRIRIIFLEPTETEEAKEERIASEIKKLLAEMLRQYALEMEILLEHNQHHVNHDPRKLERDHNTIAKRLMSSLPTKIRMISPNEPVESHRDILKSKIEKYWSSVKEKNNDKQKFLLELQEKGRQNSLKRFRAIGGSPSTMQNNAILYSIHAEQDGSENQLVFRICHRHITMGVSMNGQFEVVEVTDEGDSKTPIIVGKSRDGELVFGKEAVEQCLSQDTPLEHWWITDYLGSINFLSCKKQVSFRVGDSDQTHEVSVEFLLGFLLRSLKECAEKEYGVQFNTAIITVPIWFCSTHRIQVKDSAKIAGLENCNIMNEEAAVALSYFSERVRTKQEKKRGEYFLVLSEYFGAISGVLYVADLDESGREKLSMFAIRCFKRRDEEETKDLETAISFVHMVWDSLQMEDDSPTTTIFVTENPIWLEAFKVVSKDNDCNIGIEMSERKILAMLRGKYKDIREPLMEYLALDIYKNREDVIKHYEVMCEDWEERDVNLKYGERDAKFHQESTLETYKEVWMGTLRIGRSIWALQQVYPIFAINSEGIVSLKEVKIVPVGSDDSEENKFWNLCQRGKRITDFTWTTPNLSDEQREDLCHLIDSLFPDNETCARSVGVNRENF